MCIVEVLLKAFVRFKDDCVDKFVLTDLESAGIKVKDEADMADCDIVIAVGGDGTILRLAMPAAKAGKPLLGINTGRLGFMAAIERNEAELRSKLRRLVSGDYAVSRRMMHCVEFESGERFHALNDVVLRRVAKALPDISVLRNGVEVMSVRGDGMIVSTATGSTAYSLSAGGPIVEPELECFVVTALSPHTLSNRPMVFGSEAGLQLCSEFMEVCIDGMDAGRCGKVTVTKSEYSFDLINIGGNCFYNAIRNKLGFRGS